MAETKLAHASSPTANPRAPIHNLNFDILLTIFEINSNLHWTSRGSTNLDWASRPRPLDTLRQTSQVCRQWREIILGSASLWGMVIDLDLLAPDEEDYWTKEVMKRTGKSALYVCGQLDGSKSTSRDFFVSFLDKKWERIRRLDVTVTQGHLWGARAWDVLFRPSPELEVLKLRNRGGWYPIVSSQPNHTPPMFADIAPALREFAIDEAPSSWLSLREPWLSQLHSLVISTPSTFNATEVLAALAGIPALEHLELKNVSPRFSDQQIMPLSLPFLRTLTISKDFRTSLFFLRSINPPAGSALNLTMSEYNSISDQEIHNLCKEITRHIENFFKWSLFADSLVLEPGKHIFKIRGCRSIGEIASISSHTDFSISISGGRRVSTSLPRQATLKLLASIAACSFTHITKFEFMPSETLQDVQSLKHTLTALFSSLHAVELLVISTYGLELLLISEVVSSSDILQLLKTLWLKVGGNLDPSLTKSLVRFLRWRTIMGRAITTLDVSDSILSEQWLDWTSLDEIDGLKVILRRHEDGVEEYICGTGTPERLQLRQGF